MSTNSLRVLASALAAVFVVAAPSPADSAPTDCATVVIDPESQRLVCDTGVEVPGVTPVGAGGGQAPGGEESTPTAEWTQEILDDLCTASDDPTRTGHLVRYALIDSATGQVLRTETVCTADTAEDAPPPAPLPPAPPTREELIDATPIPEPAILANPSGRGLTGLESWFWAADDGPVTASVTLRGWTVSGTLTADHWTWTTGDGGHYDMSTSGSADDPAVRHMWETKDTWSVTLEVSWTGTYTVSGFGTTLVIDELVAEDSTTVEYPVVEVRAVLDDEPNGGEAG